MLLSQNVSKILVFVSCALWQVIKLRWLGPSTRNDENAGITMCFIRICRTTFWSNCQNLKNKFEWRLGGMAKMTLKLLLQNQNGRLLVYFPAWFLEEILWVSSVNAFTKFLKNICRKCASDLQFVMKNWLVDEHMCILIWASGRTTWKVFCSRERKAKAKIIKCLKLTLVRWWTVKKNCLWADREEDGFSDVVWGFIIHAKVWMCCLSLKADA